MVKNETDTYEFGPLLESQEQEFLLVYHNTGVPALHFSFFFSLVQPVYGALDLSLEVGGEPRWDQRHLDVLMGVWLQLAGHWLELQVVATHQARFLEVKLEGLGLVKVVQDYETV